MLFSGYLLAAGLLGLVSTAAVEHPPAPTWTPEAGYPEMTARYGFNLVAKCPPYGHTPQKLEVENWVVGSYHMGAGYGYAVLYPQTKSARTFFVNGTKYALAFGDQWGHASTLTFGGTPPFPQGLFLADDRSLWIQAGPGTGGIYPRVDDHRISRMGGAFFACPSVPSLQQEALRLYWHNKTFAPLPGHPECQPVLLLPQCAEGDVLNPREHGVNNTVPIRCYKDVASVNIP